MFQTVAAVAFYQDYETDVSDCCCCCLLPRLPNPRKILHIIISFKAAMTNKYFPKDKMDKMDTRVTTFLLLHSTRITETYKYSIDFFYSGHKRHKKVKHDNISVT